MITGKHELYSCLPNRSCSRSKSPGHRANLKEHGNLVFTLRPRELPDGDGDIEFFAKSEIRLKCWVTRGQPLKLGNYFPEHFQPSARVLLPQEAKSARVGVVVPQ